MYNNNVIFNILYIQYGRHTTEIKHFFQPLQNVKIIATRITTIWHMLCNSHMQYVLYYIRQNNGHHRAATETCAIHRYIERYYRLCVRWTILIPQIAFTTNKKEN